MTEELTTGEIRRIIYDRQKGCCRACGKFVTFEQAHLHEIVPRGKGGIISLTNSEILCFYDHIEVEHGDRKPKFTKGENKC